MTFLRRTDRKKGKLRPFSLFENVSTMKVQVGGLPPNLVLLASLCFRVKYAMLSCIFHSTEAVPTLCV